MRNLFILFFILLAQGLTFGQSLSHSDVSEDYLAGEWIIQLEEGVTLDQFLKNLSEEELDVRPTYVSALNKGQNLYLLQISEETDLNQAIGNNRRGTGLTYLSRNRRVKTRTTTPNDPQFANQWNMEKIQARLAWDISTGGLTADGDTIVVAIVDEGYEVTHVDIVNNQWRNHGEIPNDGIDNDLNGFVDDYLGLNTITDNDIHKVDEHGTAVSGIIGAEGNNDFGLSGINWNIKIMMISGIRSEADILKGYEYILESRKKYSQTNGAEGAFVVATNLSAGIDKGMAEDYPMWCGLYETMGAAGILSCGATTNNDIDVDELGDMPTTCTSDYLISVTASTETDEKFFDAGFGVTHIDIAAPGSDVITSGFGNGTTNFPGTSAATPHVAGIIALMYSAACPEYLKNLKDNPAGTVLGLKNMILESGDEAPAMKDQTKTGRRVNAFGALKAVAAICGGGVGDEISITNISPNPSDGLITISYDVVDNEDYLIQIVDMLGRVVKYENIEQPVFKNKEVRLDTKGFYPGVYYAVIRKGKEVSAQKFMVL